MVILAYDEVGVSHRRGYRKRACKAKDCKTILNSYNNSAYCHTHQAKNLMAKFDRKIQEEFEGKRHKWFQLSKWNERPGKLESIGINFKHRKIRSVQQAGKKMYAVFVKD